MSEEIKQPAIIATDRLNSIEGFSELTDLEKRIIWEHINFPESTYRQISGKFGVTVPTIYNALNSEAGKKIRFITGQHAVGDLVHLAIKTVRACMNCPNPAVRLAAAMAVLRNADLMKDKPETIKQDNKFVIVWGNKERINLSGDPNTIRPALEAAGSTRINGKI